MLSLPSEACLVTHAQSAVLQMWQEHCPCMLSQSTCKGLFPFAEEIFELGTRPVRLPLEAGLLGSSLLLLLLLVVGCPSERV